MGRHSDVVRLPPTGRALASSQACFSGLEAFSLYPVASPSLSETRSTACTNDGTAVRQT